MKKPKIKPEVVWMPWHDETGLVIEEWSYNKGTCIDRFVEKSDDTWKELRKQGWRVVKVEVREKK